MRNNLAIFALGLIGGIFILQIAVGIFINYPPINVAFYGMVIILGLWTIINVFYYPKRYFIIPYRGEFKDGFFYANLYIQTEYFPNNDRILEWSKKETNVDVTGIIPFSINEVSKSDFLTYREKYEEQSI